MTYIYALRSNLTWFNAPRFSTNYSFALVHNFHPHFSFSCSLSHQKPSIVLINDLISRHGKFTHFPKILSNCTSNKLYLIILCTTTEKITNVSRTKNNSCTISRKVYVSGKSDSGQETASDLHGGRGWSSSGSDLEEKWDSYSNQPRCPRK